MDAKLNHSDLTQLFSKEADITMAKAEVLTKAFFDLIIEGLEEDGIVKINGLGTFKITEVADRSSVNVNTGEKIEIKGHNKLTFIPADSLKDNVNQPFAMFEPVEVTSDLSEEELLESEDAIVAETAEEAVEEESNASVETIDEVVAEDANASNETSDKVVVEESNISDETKNEDKVEDENIVEPVVVTKRPEPVLVRVPKKEQGIKRDAPKKKKNYKSLYATLLVAIIIVAVYIVYSMDMISFDTAAKVNVISDKVTVENLVLEVEKPVEKQESITVVDSIKSIPLVEQESVYAFVMVDELAALDLTKITMTNTDLYQITGEWCSHKVTDNETLTKIALKHYGSKKLWPYLVKHNNFARPDAIRKGMEISIPKLEPVK